MRPIYSGKWEPAVIDEKVRWNQTWPWHCSINKPLLFQKIIFSLMIVKPSFARQLFYPKVSNLIWHLPKWVVLLFHRHASSRSWRHWKSTWGRLWIDKFSLPLSRTHLIALSQNTTVPFWVNVQDCSFLFWLPWTLLLSSVFVFLLFRDCKVSLN